jgi:hypothetical protein
MTFLDGLTTDPANDAGAAIGSPSAQHQTYEYLLY